MSIKLTKEWKVYLNSLSIETIIETNIWENTGKFKTLIYSRKWGLGGSLFLNDLYLCMDLKEVDERLNTEVKQHLTDKI